MRYDFLIDTYETERIKVVSTWSMFMDADLPVRPHPTDPRGRSFHEHMVHQCVSEDLWMRNMLGVAASLPALPKQETRQAFIDHYGRASGERVDLLADKADEWYDEHTTFFDVTRSRAWVLTRRFTHSAHHRGQLMVYLRLWGHAVYSTYGPTADTGGLFQNGARVIYSGAGDQQFPVATDKPVTERPDNT